MVLFDTVCRIYMDNMAEDGELNSRVFPLADTSRRDYPIEEPVDCTWELVTRNDHRVCRFFFLLVRIFIKLIAA